MAQVTKNIGKIPVYKGDWVQGSYGRLNQVSLFGSTFQSKIDKNTNKPAEIVEGKLVVNQNWDVVSNGTEAYLAGNKIAALEKDKADKTELDKSNAQIVQLEQDVKGIEQDTNSIQQYIDSNNIKYNVILGNNAANLATKMSNSGALLVDDYLTKTYQLDVYTNGSLAYNAYQNIIAGKYAVLVDIEFTGTNDRKLSTLSLFRNKTVVEKKDIELNKRYKICIGIYDESGGTTLTQLMFGQIRRLSDNQAITTKEDVSIKLYSLAVVTAKDLIIDDYSFFYECGFNADLPYFNTYTNSNRAMLARLAAESNHALLSDNSTLSAKADYVKTAWEGVTWSALGDSLVGWQMWQRYVSSAMRNTYRHLVGVNGGTVSPNSEGVGFYQLSNTNLLPVDLKLLVVLAGANDGVSDGVGDNAVFNPAKLGSIYDKPLTTAQLEAGAKPTTFCQAYNTMLWNIQKRCPACRVFICTQTKYFNGYYSEGVHESVGAKEKVDAIRKMAELWGFPLIDLWGECGANYWNKMLYYPNEDGGELWVHHRESLGKRIAEVVIGRLIDIQPWNPITVADYGNGTIESDSKLDSEYKYQ